MKSHHLVLALTYCCLSLAQAQNFAGAGDDEPLNQNPLQAQIQSHPREAAPGSQGEIVVKLDLAPKYHAYLDKFKLEWKGDGKQDTEPVKIGKIDISPVHEFNDTFSGKVKQGIKGEATLKALIELPSRLPPGEHALTYNLTYQACTVKHCLFPKKIPLTAQILIREDGAPASASLAAGGGFIAGLKAAAAGDVSFKEVAGRGFLFSLLVIFLAGVLTSLTPCVYPMIPITLAVIGAKSAESDRFKSFSLSSVYVLGIAFTFSALGVFAALTGSLFGSALSHPAVVFTLAGIFVLLGLSMYGVFNIQAPAFIQNRLGLQKRGGYPGAFFAGLVSGIVAGPCVGPVLIGVLAHVGEKQDAVYGFSLLFSYSLGMGLLFLVLGTSSGLLQKLPKAGGWMKSTKYVFGTIMIAMAFYYVQPFIFSKPASARSEALAQWKPYSDDLLTQAKARGLPAIIDFSAEWCVACKELEQYTFPDPEVRKLGDQFVLMKFDATEDSPQLEALRERYQVLGLPTLIFVDRSGEIRKELTLTGFEKADAFAKRMRQVL